MGKIIYPNMRRSDVQAVDGKHYVVGTSKRTLDDYGINDSLFGSPYSVLTLNEDDVIWVDGFDTMQTALNSLKHAPKGAVDFLTV